MIKSGRDIFGRGKFNIYSLLKHMEPGLLLDVGAAAGNMSLKMLEQSPDSKIMTFEPFPGNLPILTENLEAYTNVEIINKAVSDKTGKATFNVPSIASGDVKGVGNVKNYSSTGFLETSACNTGFAQSIEVETVILSKVIKEHVRFLKIDVQGGEPAVLRGAHGLIDDFGIDMIFIEFIGQLEVLQFLLKRNYIIYDTIYMLIPINGLPEWDWVNHTTVTTGDKAVYGWPNEINYEPEIYSKFMYQTRKNFGYVHTDLLTIHSSYIDKFEEALIKNNRT